MITTVHIAPGVYIRVVPIEDNTPANVRPNLYALIFLTAEKGPANEVVFVPNRDIALRLFGNPDPKRDRGLLYLLNYVDTVPAYAVRLVPKSARLANVGLALVPVIDPDTGQVAQDQDGRFIFTFKFVYGDLSLGYRYVNNQVYTADPNNTIPVSYEPPVTDFADSTAANTAILLGIFAGRGPGAYYNKIGLNIAPYFTDYSLVNIEFIEQGLTDVQVLSVVERASVLSSVDEFGYQRRIDYLINDTTTIPVQYIVSEQTVAWLQGEIPGPTNIAIQYLDSTNNFQLITKPVSDIIGSINASDILVTAITNYAADYNLPSGTVNVFLRGGSEGELWNGNIFNWSVFTQMVVDAVKGTTDQLPESIHELIVEDAIRIKYIIDPTDERTKQADPDGYQAVKIALNDYAHTKWNTNTGAIVLADEGPIAGDVMQAKHIVTDFLYASYVSYSETAIPEYNAVVRVPHLYHVTKDLPRARVEVGMYMPFAGIDTATHTGIKRLVREFTIDERDILTEEGFNYIIRDEYGYYTDLDRTTLNRRNPFRWLYIVEMLVDIKWEVAHLCKPWKHRLETAQWDRLKQIISEYVLKPRVDAGYITDYNVRLIMDRKYIDQNMIPIEIEIRPAREIERIVVTIYVR